MKFTVDRQTWYRGKDTGESKLLRYDGTRCCIGFVGKQVGCTDDDLLDVAEVIKMDSNNRNFPVWMREPYTHKGGGRTLIGEAYHVNDDENLTDEQREARLKELFIEAGDEIEFIN